MHISLMQCYLQEIRIILRQWRSQDFDIGDGIGRNEKNVILYYIRVYIYFFFIRSCAYCIVYEQ